MTAVLKLGNTKKMTRTDILQTSESVESGKYIFTFSDSVFSFEWIRGTKTINIYSDSKVFDTCSFDHHLSKTTKRRALQIIGHWRKTNE